MLNKYHPEGNIQNYENELPAILERYEREKEREKVDEQKMSEIKTQSTFITFIYPLIKWPFTQNMRNVNECICTMRSAIPKIWAAKKKTNKLTIQKNTLIIMNDERDNQKPSTGWYEPKWIN